ncbi:MAG: NADH-quinone oxidoreductase subunit L [Isosphaeraceae bacterium]
MSWQVGLYVAAVLIPLAAFTVEAIFIRQLKRLNAYIATGAIFLSFILSFVGFVNYFGFTAPWGESESHVESHEPGANLPGESGPEARHPAERFAYSTPWVSLGGLPASNGAPARPALVVPLGVSVDNLGAIMFLMVTFIATLIHIYSIGYMHDDPRFPQFFTYLSLFCFSMLGLVAASNAFMIFFFWELVGVCSYLLIGFWYEEKVNGDAANKAFIVNRVGDVGMLLGLGLLWSSLGTLDFKEINEGLRGSTGELHATGTAKGDFVQLFDRGTGQVKTDAVTGEPLQIPYWMLTIAGLGIFAGCVGKSAQFPLHVWLPDAMAGPTPVSALIHAATMVAAGVYLVGRFFPLFTGDVLLYIAYTGGVTLFIAATIAMVQTDYKKVLAYSTVSQLGFMILGLGVGGWVAGLFHLITHACFKALLFLCAGSVYHSVHTYEMPALGGLYKKMPWTANCMLVGTLAISGVPLFSGFYSKDAILAAAMARVQEDPKHFMLFLLPAVGAVLTAFYMFRMWFLVFAGEARGFPSRADEVYAHATDEEHALDTGHDHEDAHGHDDAHDHGDIAHGHASDSVGAQKPAPHHHHDLNPVDHAHESDWIMVGPLVALAVLSVIVGWGAYYIIPNPLTFLGLGGEPLLVQMLDYGEPYRALDPAHLHHLHYYALVSSFLIAAVGIGLALLYYAPAGFPYFLPTRLDAVRTAERFGGVYKFLVHKWYFDELYWAVLVRPCLAFARICREIDRILVDGLVNGSAAATAFLSRLEGIFDMIAVDRLVNLTANAVYVAGDWSRSIQTGRLRNYLMLLTVGVIVGSTVVLIWIQR